MNRLFSFSLVILIALLCTACSASVDRLKNDTNTQFDEMRGIQAEHTAQLSEIRAEIRSLGGRLEELQYVSKGKAIELERTLQQLGSRVPPPPGVPEKLLNADEDKIAAIQGDAANRYRAALIKLRSGDFESARQQFSDFATNNPGTAFTDNALFWLGISYKKLGQRDQAIVAFSDVLSSYPAEDMVQPSMFYLAEVFALSGSKDDAILTLQRLIDEHPRSEYAKESKQKIRSLKKRRR